MMELTGTGIRTVQDLSGGASASGNGEELGKTQFLELMIAQMNNQNPLDPAKNEDFIAQLAQFSTVEGIENLNTSFAGLAASLQSSVATDAAALVGRNVVVPTNTAALASGSGIEGSIEVPRSSAGVTVDITNQSGDLVRRIDLGAQPEGRLRFGWDGSNAAGEASPQGFYQVRAYSNFDGELAELTVNMPDQVVSVSIGVDGVTANLAGGSSVPASQIKEIQ
jgi:flagellar basal-body rod modification protein FlgD